MSEAAASSQFTGERPGSGKDFDYDESRHLAAYRYARELAVGKRVLDAGCGDGWGTQSLAEVAEEVVGIDYSAEAIDHCRRTWTRPNLRFEQVDLTRRENFEERFDLIVNFQVLEHIANEVAFLERLKKLLARGGTLLLTTPNRLKSFSENPYHLREYTAQELRALLQRVFADVGILGMHGNAKVAAFDRERARSVQRILRLDPFGLRRFLPVPVVRSAFATFAVLVRRRARAAGDREPITVEDFEVREENVDEALDLVALVRA